jgi:Ca2+-binding RTX toxin-like protein
MRRAAILLAAASLAACLAPAGASAHSLVRVNGTELSYQSVDATSLNTLTVEPSNTEIHVRDPTVDGGMDQGTCRPGDVDANGYVIEAFCTAANIQSVRVDVAEREDKVTVTVALPTTALGGPGADSMTTAGRDDVLVGDEGNDTLVSGDGNDQISGGPGDDAIDAGGGNDVAQGGQGADRLDGGDGDDELRARDGVADQVTCGPGND